MDDKKIEEQMEELGKKAMEQMKEVTANMNETEKELALVGLLVFMQERIRELGYDIGISPDGGFAILKEGKIFNLIKLHDDATSNTGVFADETEEGVIYN